MEARGVVTGARREDRAAAADDVCVEFFLFFFVKNAARLLREAAADMMPPKQAKKLTESGLTQRLVYGIEEGQYLYFDDTQPTRARAPLVDKVHVN